MPAYKIINLGVCAHVDAGKTTTTERLLFHGKAIETLGSVDLGTTQTDSLDIERKRGITVRSAVTSFSRKGLKINVIDTPGHPDFIAEVSRVLDVLDGVILVISAVEGVQSQTSLLYRAFQKAGLPSVFFVNKIDRQGARVGLLLNEMRQRLTPQIVPLGSVTNIGQNDASYRPYSSFSSNQKEEIIELLADNDETLLQQYVEDGAIENDQVLAALKRQTQNGQSHPVVFGSAVTGEGIAELADVVGDYLPAAASRSDGADEAKVFKIERSEHGGSEVYARVTSGSLRQRQRIYGGNRQQKITGLEIFGDGSSHQVTVAHTGEIVKISGLHKVTIGSCLGSETSQASQAEHFAPPFLESEIKPCDAEDGARLYDALLQLSQQDPLIHFQQKESAKFHVTLYGEVQKEVLLETLQQEFALAATCGPSSVVHVEKLVGVGEAYREAPNPYLATIGLRIEPAVESSEDVFVIAVDGGSGSLSQSFFAAVLEGAQQGLRQGLHGWPVIGYRLTMTKRIQLRDWATSTPAEHRKLAFLVVREALQQAKTQVNEPIHSFRLECPASCLASVLAMVSRLSGVSIHSTSPLYSRLSQVVSTQLSTQTSEPGIDRHFSVIIGQVSAGQLHRLRSSLPGLTAGEGFVESEFSCWQPVESCTNR